MENICFEKVNFTYALGDRPALNDVSFFVKEGEMCLVIGKSAAGKSTLLRLIKKEIAPAGKLSGKITVPDGIGFVSQNVEESIVCDRVRSELSFGLTNLGLPKEYIELKVNETAGYFNLSSKLDSEISSLSGGEKQILNLASVMITKPQVLVLDEPTCQLDPVWAERFINVIKKLHRDFGTTVIIAEHLLGELYDCTDSVMLVENATVETKTSSEKMIEYLKKSCNPLLESVPLSFRLFDAMGDISLCRKKLTQKNLPPLRDKNEKGKAAIKAKSLIFSYKKNTQVIKNLSFIAYENKINVILGANSSGKSTLLKLMSGVLKQQYGKIKKDKAVSMLCQNPRDLFTKEKCSDEVQFGELTAFLEIDEIKDSHPYDISEGQAQRLALAKVLQTGADIILLDEPTKALDSAFKQKLASKLESLCDMGKTIVITTHDVNFAAEYGEYISFLSNGEIITTQPKRAFFSSLDFFTSSAFKITHGILEGYVCEKDLEGVE